MKGHAEHCGVLEDYLTQHAGVEQVYYPDLKIILGMEIAV